jgi:hypothetical protein
MALGEPKAMAETGREAAKEAAGEVRTRILHEGRGEVERVVTVVGKKTKKDG